MAIDPVDLDLKYIAEGLNHPESGERYQKAKTEFTYRQMKGQIETFEQQQIAIEVQREAIAVQKAAIVVQKAAAAAEAKAPDLSKADSDRHKFLGRRNQFVLRGDQDGFGYAGIARSAQ